MDVPRLPHPTADVAQDPEGYSAEMSVERPLRADELESFARAVRKFAHAVGAEGLHEMHGHLTVDDAILWVDVQSSGPGTYGSEQRRADEKLLLSLWEGIHEAVAR